MPPWPTVLARQDDVFPHMLGLIRGRIYYNLLSWYRVLALLPGFTFNRRFMEQMMGVKEGLPENVVAVAPKPVPRPAPAPAQASINLDVTERAKPARDDDDLQIPAFLRRQAN